MAAVDIRCSRRAATAVEHAQLDADVQESDRRKNEFLATLAYELRNPLAPIRNGLQVLRPADEPAAREQAREMIERQTQGPVGIDALAQGGIVEEQTRSVEVIARDEPDSI